jgi:hypothetical protein
LNYEYSDVPFSLKTDEEGIILGNIPDDIRLISSVEEFNFYLDLECFDDDFSTDFTDENAKYNSDYFLECDLIAIIYHSTSGTTIDVKIESVKPERDEAIVVTLRTTPGNDVGTADMAGYFTFYVTVKKLDPSLDYISFVVK